MKQSKVKAYMNKKKKKKKKKKEKKKVKAYIIRKISYESYHSLHENKNGIRFLVQY